MELDKNHIQKEQKIEQQVASMRDAINDVVAFFPQLARLCKSYYDNLRMEGFTEEQATTIIARYSSDVLTGK